MPSPVFEFFEMVAEELTLEPSRVLTAADLDPDGNHVSVLDELREYLGVMTNDKAIQEAVKILAAHFSERGCQLPFTYDSKSARFVAVDAEYLQFVTDIRQIRGVGKSSKQFELSVMNRLKLRVTGALHRVGHPRDKRKKLAELNDYLKKLGFDGSVVAGKEKDGGLDILWMLPLGASDRQPIVSVQCKNGDYTTGAGDGSIGTTLRTLNQHRSLMAQVHVLCVLFNDYITTDVLPKKELQWVPLGVSDLGRPHIPLAAVAL